MGRNYRECVASWSAEHWLILIVLLNWILAIPSFWVPYYNNDEVTNALFARFHNSGELSFDTLIGHTSALTRYLFTWVYAGIDRNSLIPMHILHALWKSGTILALYWTGTLIAGRKVGLWSALFYCVASYSFLSKDFHSPRPESLSLLPAALASGCFLSAMTTRRGGLFVLAGALAAAATLFKAPMGVIIVAMGITLLCRSRGAWKAIMPLAVGFVLTLLAPACFVSPFGQGFVLMLQSFSRTTDSYIQFHQNPFFYWGSKFLLRTTLVFASLFALVVFATYELRQLFLVRRRHELLWDELFYLASWLFLLLFAVTLGKRVFYHYYVFLLVPLSLLAGLGLAHFDSAFYLPKSERLGSVFAFLKGVRRHIGLFLALPLLGFSLEGAFNYSTRAIMPSRFTTAIAYIRSNTHDGDRIYVWGYIPQLYFYSGRLPATPYFWSDILAGWSPGSPAMEYLHATKQPLSLREQLLKDFTAKPFSSEKADPMDEKSELIGLNETELFDFNELLERITQPYWKKVFLDFLKHPPELFIDTSPTNYHGFGYYPIRKYELLKRFVFDNYALEATVDGLLIYRLRH